MLSAIRQVAVFSTPLSRTVSQKVMHPTKFTSILQNVPVRPVSGWQIFLREQLHAQKAKGEKVAAAVAIKEVSSRWKSLSDAERQKYTDLYQKEAKVHDDAYQKAMNSASPQQFYDENLLRRRYKLPVLKDPKAPKRPHSAYFLFLAESRKSDPRLISLSVSEQAREASKLFKELPAHEKERFNKLSDESKENYRREMDKYMSEITEHKLPSEKPKKKAASKTDSKKTAATKSKSTSTKKTTAKK
ncbi:high mobility group box domain-containing protein [Syncephalastrum racemosum]|uniref:High mobility group box domain-containing protein n=1 Tax=Syncephalastrum racemosum TaxID=13706 RepID=A0A1X2H0P1_SYNRA|nr:high mobility group box domain-containing protein [Syncephalastrum racemosum]